MIPWTQPHTYNSDGASGSTHSSKYVQWGIRKKGNEELRNEFIRDTRPMLAEIGIEVPDERANRRFLSRRGEIARRVQVVTKRTARVPRAPALADC